jgi:hypothetical protein
MNYRSVVLATTILIGEKSSTSCLIARHLDEKSRDGKQRIEEPGNKSVVNLNLDHKTS